MQVSSSTWLCASPANAIAATQAIAEKLQIKPQLTFRTSLSLTAKQMREVHEEHPRLFKIIVQQEGDIIDVVPGWFHAVANEGTGILKCAIEKLTTPSLPHTLWARNIERVFHPLADPKEMVKASQARHYTPEYVAPGQLLAHELLKWSEGS